MARSRFGRWLSKWFSFQQQQIVQATVTDLHGKFAFPQKLEEGDILIFSFIGFTTKEYHVPRNPESTIEIRFTLDMCVLMGEAAVAGVYEEPRSGFSKLVTKVTRLF